MFDFAQQEGNRQAYLCRMFVAGEAPLARRTTGSATRPLVAAMKGRPRPRERTENSWEGRGGRAAAGQGSVEGEGGARADLVESGRRRGSEGRRRVAVPKERPCWLVAVCSCCPSKQKALLLLLIAFTPKSRTL